MSDRTYIEAVESTRNPSVGMIVALDVCKEWRKLDKELTQVKADRARLVEVLSRVQKVERGLNIKNPNGLEIFRHENDGIIYRAFATFCEAAIEAVHESKASG